MIFNAYTKILDILKFSKKFHINFKLTLIFFEDLKQVIKDPRYVSQRSIKVSILSPYSVLLPLGATERILVISMYIKQLLHNIKVRLKAGSDLKNYNEIPCYLHEIHIH